MTNSPRKPVTRAEGLCQRKDSDVRTEAEVDLLQHGPESLVALAVCVGVLSVYAWGESRKNSIWTPCQCAVWIRLASIIEVQATSGINAVRNMAKPPTDYNQPVRRQREADSR